ncbi:hypothetical protein EVAR_47975_1, partial [Eumeta japonica]
MPENGWHGLKGDAVTRLENGVSLWFDGGMETVNESRLTQEVYRPKVYDGMVCKGRPRNPHVYRIGSILKRRPNFKHPKPMSMLKIIYGWRVSYGVLQNWLTQIHIVQRTKLYRSELPANDVLRKYNAPQTFLLLLRVPNLRYCDAFLTNFTAAEFRA